MGNKALSAATLKNIALFTMLIDHICAILVHRHASSAMDILYRTGRCIGRISFVLYAYLIVEGMIHTRNKLHYILRLGLLALLSEIPFDLAFYGKYYYPDSQNVFLTLAIGAIGIFFLDKWKASGILQGIVAILCCMLAFVVKSDYSFAGVLLIQCLFLFRCNFFLQAVMGTIVLCGGMSCLNLIRYYGKGYETSLLISLGMNEIYGSIAYLLIGLYDGTKGKQLPKYFYYFFYPIHLVILYGCKCILFR